MKLQRIELKFYYYDEEEREHIISGDISQKGWQQWGADKERLGDNVDLIEELNKIAIEHLEIEED